MKVKLCLQCGQSVKKPIKYSYKQWARFKYCSNKCHAEANKNNPRIHRSGSNNNLWLGEKVGYCGIHDWLRAKYGSATFCENKECKGISPNYEWAKLKEKSYQRRRGNFVRLCRSCHRKYDKSNYQIVI